MSMQFWEIRGYGVQFDANNGTNTTPEKIRTLLEFAPDFKSEIKEYFEEIEIDYNTATVDDFADFEQDYYTGIPYLIAKVMNERYDCYNFMSVDSDENGTLFLYMSACMPWEMTDFEKNISKEQLTLMIKENCNILYDNVIVDDVSIHNFG